MTEQEKVWFKEIAKNREDAWNIVFSKRAFRNIMQGVVEKYAGLGHFVYELLQNADDAGATAANFELRNDRLIFRHNGGVHFSVTSLKSEDQGESGHLNAITSVGASAKVLENNLGNAIGKFGVGFKAVFKYTNRPEIYDDNMSFALEHYIVPKLIADDFPGRRAGETVFVLPFDRDDKPNARDEIWRALKSLVFPTLFLSHLKRLEYRFGDQLGEYRVDSLLHDENVRQHGMTVQKLSVVAHAPTGEQATPLWLFSSNQDGHRCSVGFAINEKGEIVPADYFAFCFFPTRHPTKLKFIVHAPFLLNDSREGILSGQQHNERMVERLSVLAADGIKYLCSRHKDDGVQIVTDDIVKILPISQEDYGDGISFEPFRAAFLNLFQTAAVLPTKGGYVDRPHAYWAESIAVPRVFSDDQLQSLYGVKGIGLAFPTIPQENKWRNVGKDLTADVFDFIEKCTNECVKDNDLIGHITAAFIERQPMAWLESLYDWIAANDQRVRKARTAPIFFNQHGKACAVKAEDDTDQMYLPLEGEERYDMVRADLLANEHAKRLLDKYKLKEPDRRDWIQLILTQKMPSADKTRADGLMREVLGYYVTCGIADQEVVISHLKGIPCWLSSSGDDKLYKASELYVESADLHRFFDRIGGTHYIDAKHYFDMVDPKYQRDMEALFEKVGIADAPRLEKVSLLPEESQTLFMDKNHKWRRSTSTISFEEAKIDGLGNFLQQILSASDPSLKKELSVLLWDLLGKVAANKARELRTNDVAGSFRQYMEGVYHYTYYGPKQQPFVSRHYQMLLDSAWLVASNGAMVAPKLTAKDALDIIYSESKDFAVICSALSIAETSNAACETLGEQQARAALSDAAKDALALGEQADRLGLSADDLEEMARIKASKKIIPPMEKPQAQPLPPQVDETEKRSGSFEEAKQAAQKAVKKTRTYKDKNPVLQGDMGGTLKPILPAIDSDPMQPRTIGFEKKAEELRKKVEAQIDQLKVESELQDMAVEAEEYSYAWLMARLELEMRASGADGDENREAVVSFAKMEREPGTENMFMLSATSEAIPQWFEEEVNQRLTIRIPGRQDIETVIESMSVMSFRLRAKVRILPGMENIDYSQVVEAKTVATKPTFLLNALKEGYESLGLSEDYDMKANLPEQMRFIFGPPGTGKTTYLARKELIPLAKSDAHPHVLVLTPTNKAADVLTKRIIVECGEDESYKQWLTRFGITLDTTLQGNPVARAKDVEIDDEHSVVVVSTVIRYAYDAFTSMDKTKIADFKWDYIVVDEASMIPLMQILYPIYKAKGARFVIAGDPMQIAPVVMSDLSVGQNIYTMVGLEDFANPRTEPHDYEVICLSEQYRSVPCIGRVFSEFAYSGKLRHHRSPEEERDLNVTIDGMPTIKPLTLLRYPVSRFESIFKIKLLGMSSYQIYSALFIFEYICKLAEGLRKAGRAGFRIGVISPYRAQADIVGRLVAKMDHTMLASVEINVGTVHSFQGDECEMIIALLNPPQGMGRHEGSFINDKKVLNVAISRARDYLVVAIPDEKTPNIQYLRGPLSIARLMRQTPGVFAELQTPDLESSVWGDRDYVEMNTYSTGHQNVNVYETPEKRFEVRSEDAALDVHFRADRHQVVPDDGFVSERERIEIEVTADERAREDFKVPPGFHKPTEGEQVPAMKQYYVIGNAEPKFCEDEMEDIDPSLVLAIED